MSDRQAGPLTGGETLFADRGKNSRTIGEVVVEGLVRNAGFAGDFTH